MHKDNNENDYTNAFDNAIPIITGVESLSEVFDKTPNLLPNTNINTNSNQNKPNTTQTQTQNVKDDRPFTTVIGGQGLSGINVEGDIRRNHGGVSYYLK